MRPTHRTRHRRPVTLVPTAPGAYSPRPQALAAMSYPALTRAPSGWYLRGFPLLPPPTFEATLHTLWQRQQTVCAAAQPPSCSGCQANFHAPERACAADPLMNSHRDPTALAHRCRGRARSSPPLRPTAPRFLGSCFTADQNSTLRTPAESLIDIHNIEGIPGRSKVAPHRDLAASLRCQIALARVCLRAQ